MALFLAAALVAATPTGFAEQSPGFRERMDRLALSLPADPIADAVYRSAEALPLDLLGADGMTAEEEYRRAAGVHERRLNARLVAPTPAEARRVFDRLVAELPPHLKPAAFPYRLTVLDLPGDAAFTNGGGFVSISRPWLSTLLADPEGNDAALAFALADEIGHVALGQCRRRWEHREAAAALTDYAGLPLAPPPLDAGFSYTPAEQYEADRFALHLCRNAGFDLDAAPDALRLLAGRKNDKGDVQLANFSDGRGGDALVRLRRVLMERDGLMDGDGKFGLFLFDRRSGRLRLCGPRQVKPGDRPVVLIHGFRGNEYALGDYLFALAVRPEFADRPLLVFRYPNNGSLSRAGQLLTREMRRCVADPERAIFVSHSAGGLVFRWYAEVRHGGFDRAIFLAVPQAGARTAEYKAVVDVGRFLLDLSAGLGYAVDDTFGEGDGQIAEDLYPDSLFLRRLGRETPPVARYQIFYGKFLDWTQALEVRLAFAEAKSYAKEGVADLVPFPRIRAWLTRQVETAPLPEAVTDGDLVVSVQSAVLPGVSKITALPLQHEAFRFDPGLIRRVTADILER